MARANVLPSLPRSLLTSRDATFILPTTPNPHTPASVRHRLSRPLKHSTYQLPPAWHACPSERLVRRGAAVKVFCSRQEDRALSARVTAPPSQTPGRPRRAGGCGLFDSKPDSLETGGARSQAVVHRARDWSRAQCLAAPVLPSSASPVSSGSPSPTSVAAPPAEAGEALAPPCAPPLSTVVAESEAERRACAVMRAQLLYPYAVPQAPSPPAFAHRDADAMASVYHQLESRTRAEFSRDSTLKQLGLPVLSFLALSSSDEVLGDALRRQQVLVQGSHPARKPLLACPELGLPLARRSVWHQWGSGNARHAAQQQHEMVLLHNGVGDKALGLATLDLQLPTGPGDLPLGPSESMRLRKVQQQRRSLPDKFNSWLGSAHGVLHLSGDDIRTAEEENEAEDEDGKLRGGYIFNLCVAHLFRRQGIARRLLCHVAQYARDVQQLDCLRMHAECSNKAAVTLYSSLGFEVEHEETEQEAAALRRPRRVLFRLTF